MLLHSDPQVSEILFRPSPGDAMVQFQRVKEPTLNVPEATPSQGLRHSWYVSAKAYLDSLLAVLLSMPALPLLLVLGLLVKLTSRGPVLYAQVRLGLNGRPFTLYKLRTMTHNCERLSGVCWSTPGDPRVTPLGQLLRATHLDELPQLWNILRGEMSLIGPRPERPEFVPALERAIPNYRERLQVRPGVTGLAQVQLPPDVDVAGVRRKLAYDLYYIRRLSCWLDLRILVCTVLHVFGLPCHTLCQAFLMPGEERPELDAALTPQHSAC
jgi:lipopolysaccharide/colanic/teichoic acid biosynthesis glycosyltransferase